MIKLITGITIFLFIYTTESLAQSEPLTIPLSNPGKTYTLNVGLTNGSIKVTAYAGKEILIEDLTPTEIEQKTGENGMKRISKSGGYELTANENNNEVIVRGPMNRTVNLSLKIPQYVKLKLEVVNNGNIEVENVKGEVEANNVNGSVYLKNISGSVVASTINGELVVSFLSVNPDASMGFSSFNRKVDVTFPANMKADLKLKSDYGEIYTDFDMDLQKQQLETKQQDNSGTYKIVKDGWVYGKINGGGPEIMMTSVNGSIYIRKPR
jgi:DUF4097 and DUF4098 domain-containing protein YvlB